MEVQKILALLVADFYSSVADENGVETGETHLRIKQAYLGRDMIFRDGIVVCCVDLPRRKMKFTHGAKQRILLLLKKR